jgi:hypothetical protein
MPCATGEYSTQEAGARSPRTYSTEARKPGHFSIASGLVNLPSLLRLFLTHRCRKDASWAFVRSPCHVALSPSPDHGEPSIRAGITKYITKQFQRKPAAGTSAVPLRSPIKSYNFKTTRVSEYYLSLWWGLALCGVVTAVLSAFYHPTLRWAKQQGDSEPQQLRGLIRTERSCARRSRLPGAPKASPWPTCMATLGTLGGCKYAG